MSCKKVLLAFFLIFSSAALFAQATGITSPGPAQPNSEPSFRLADSEKGALFVQRLSWEKAQFAIRYVILLERKNEATGAWNEVLRRSVSADYTYHDVSVPAGQYRYRIASFNILDQLDSQTQWQEFTVIQALQPSILSFTPPAFYFDRLTPRIINLTGENLLPDTDLYLISKTQLDETGTPLVIKPAEMHRNELGETARLIFDEESLVLGKYEIIARNPGGLSARIGDFSIEIAKPFDINVSGGYAPMLAIFGQKDYFLNKIFIPGSLVFRGSFVPFKWRFGNLGAEVSPAWAYLSSDNADARTSANLVMVHFNALFQYWLVSNSLSVNGRAGLGVTGIFNYHFVYNTGKKGKSMSTAAFTYDFGASVQWFPYKQIFIEGGIDFVHVAHPEAPMGFIRLGICGGYQF